jgi:hypothetical protein
VSMTTGEPESATHLEVLNGANKAALVAVDGTAEIVQWRTATQEADGTWTLTGLLRGRRGTEDLIASRGIGDAFIILDGTRLLYDAAASEVTAVRQLKAVGIFDTPDTAPGVVTKARRGRAERPYAPVHLAGSRDGSNNLTVSWVRRTRAGGELVNGSGTVALSESTEAYEVDVLNGPPPVGKAYAALEGTAANAFDASATTDWLSTLTVNWLRVTFDSDETVREYEILARANSAGTDSPRDWTFEGQARLTPSFFGDGGTPANLFDDGLAEWSVSTASLPRHGGVTFLVPQTVAQYSVTAPGSSSGTDSPRDWTLEGSNDLSTWIVLDTRAGITGWSSAETRSYTLAGPVSYLSYRLRVTANQGGGNTRVRELQLAASVGGPNVATGWVVLDTRTSQTGWTNGLARSYTLGSAATYARFRLRVTAGNGGSNRGFAELRLRRLTGAAGGNIAASNYAPATVRTITATGPTAVYSAALQTTDFGAAQAEAFVRVQQISGQVGRGMGTEARL